MRLSTVTGGSGSIDTPRGFAVKMEADRGYPQAASAHDTVWDFVSLMPESTHMVMWQMSDRTLPRSFRTMEGFGVHTFRLVDARGESTFVKFHWKPKLGLQSTLWDEAVKIAGADPDFLAATCSRASSRVRFRSGSWDCSSSTERSRRFDRRTAR